MSGIFLGIASLVVGIAASESARKTAKKNRAQQARQFREAQRLEQLRFDEEKAAIAAEESKREAEKVKAGEAVSEVAKASRDKRLRRRGRQSTIVAGGTPLGGSTVLG